MGEINSNGVSSKIRIKEWINEWMMNNKNGKIWVKENSNDVCSEIWIKKWINEWIMNNKKRKNMGERNSNVYVVKK